MCCIRGRVYHLVQSFLMRFSYTRKTFTKRCLDEFYVLHELTSDVVRVREGYKHEKIKITWSKSNVAKGLGEED